MMQWLFFVLNSFPPPKKKMYLNLNGMSNSLILSDFPLLKNEIYLQISFLSRSLIFNTVWKGTFKHSKSRSLLAFPVLLSLGQFSKTFLDFHSRWEKGILPGASLKVFILKNVRGIRSIVPRREGGGSKHQHAFRCLFIPVAFLMKSSGKHQNSCFPQES